MTKDQLTTDKLKKINGLSNAIANTAIDSETINSPIDPKAPYEMWNSPMSHYAYLIDRHGLNDLYETFRLILYSALQRKEQAHREELLTELNNVG